MGSLRLGAEHGSLCVGCCWLLMALLFVGGIMNLLWIAGLMIFVLLEKIIPTGRLVPRLAGAAMARLAINTLLKWHRRGVDVERHLPALSAYLGHAHVTDTQWYLTATPQLLRYVLRRVERSERRGRP